LAGSSGNRRPQYRVRHGNPQEDPVIVEIQCLPFPPGTDQNPYAHIEAAIALVQASGLKYEVDALGTTIEGEPDAVWALVRKMHEACLDAGANALVSVVKFEQSRAATPPTIGSLTGKFREGRA
jgi:uncharacterized protein YqgV (UPF0045/DUF77 family)